MGMMIRRNKAAKEAKAPAALPKQKEMPVKEEPKRRGRKSKYE